MSWEYWTYQTQIQGDVSKEIDIGVERGYELVSHSVEPWMVGDKIDRWLRRWIWRKWTP